MIKNVFKITIILMAIIVLILNLAGCMTDEQKLERYQKKLNNDDIDKRLSTLDKLVQLDENIIIEDLENVIINDESAEVREKALSIYCGISIAEKKNTFFNACIDSSASIRIIAYTNLFSLDLYDDDLIKAIEMGLADIEPTINLMTIDKVIEVLKSGNDLFYNGKVFDSDVEMFPQVFMLLKTLSDHSDAALSNRAIEALGYLCESKYYLDMVSYFAFDFDKETNSKLTKVLDIALRNGHISYDEAFLYAYTDIDYNHIAIYSLPEEEQGKWEEEYPEGYASKSYFERLYRRYLIL